MSAPASTFCLKCRISASCDSLSGWPSGKPATCARWITGSVRDYGGMCSQRENRTYADAEVVSVVLADVLDEVDRVIEPALSRLPLFDTARRVTTQCQNVAASRVVGFLQVSKRKMRDEGETAGEEVRIKAEEKRSASRQNGVSGLAVSGGGKTRTLRALSTISTGMFVHVRCMQVSRPRSECAVLTKLVVASEVEPPAPHLEVWQSGTESRSRVRSARREYGRDVDKDGTELSHALDAVVQVDPSFGRLGSVQFTAGSVRIRSSSACNCSDE
jgi:hypothetical protein